MNNQPEAREAEVTVPAEEQRDSQRSVKVLWAIIFVLSIVLTAFVTFSWTVRTFCHTADPSSAKLQTIEKLLDSMAYYNPQKEDMIEAALKAYASATGDRHTRYYTAEEYEVLTQKNEGNYVGIGAATALTTIDYLGNQISVLEVIGVFSQSSASEKGLKTGDYIYAVRTEDGIYHVNEDGKDLVVNHLSGKAGTTVGVLWLSPGDPDYELKEAEIVRQEIVSASVESFVSDVSSDIGVVKLRKFDITTPRRLDEALESLKKNGVDKVVLDLRDNSGGDLISVIACADFFVEYGSLILTSKNKDGVQDTYTAVECQFTDLYEPCSIAKEDVGKHRDIKFVVLVNGKTASAAELLTAVFRDYDIASVIGEKTYGKGSIQTLIPLAPYGFEGAIKITTSLYYPPCGEGYDGVGITPDIVVEKSKDVNGGSDEGQVDNQLDRAISELENMK